MSRLFLFGLRFAAIDLAEVDVSSTHVRHETFVASAASGLSIPEGLRRAADSACMTILDTDLRPHRIDYRELADFADRAALTLRAHSVTSEDRVCLLAPTSSDILITLFGIWRLGATPVVMPRPRRGTTTEAFVEEVQRRTEAAEPALVVTTEETAQFLAERSATNVVSLRELRAHNPSGDPALAMPVPSTIGLLQFTSGTTAASRAVAVTQEQLICNVAAAGERAGFGSTDRFVSWLPLYHDMGIVSLAGMAAGGADIVMMATERFMEQPGCWMRTVSHYRATMTAAPNFAYGLAAKVQALRPAALNLASLRVAINGAEAIDPEALASTQEILSGVGLRRTSICPMYGLAEATLAVSGSSWRDRARIIEPSVAEADEAVGEARPQRRLVSCGRPIPGTDVQIRGHDGRFLPDGAVGEVSVRGPGVTAGYWTPGGRIEAGDTVRDGWLATGDLGFLDRGELVICGRIKDMVIAGGRNLYPEDYEQVAERVPGVRSGNVVAFSLPDRERMVVVAEGRRSNLEDLGRRIVDALREEVEHAPHVVVFIKPGTLPKTSSGKRQRQATRELFLEDSLEVLHVVR